MVCAGKHHGCRKTLNVAPVPPLRYLIYCRLLSYCTYAFWNGFGIWNWFLGVLKPTEHEFGNKKFLRSGIEGLQVDFQKIPTLSVELEISYFVFLMSGTRKINEKVIRRITEGLHANFPKWYIRVFQCQEHKCSNEKFLSCITEDLHVDFQICQNRRGKYFGIDERQRFRLAPTRILWNFGSSLPHMLRKFALPKWKT